MRVWVCMVLLLSFPLMAVNAAEGEEHAGAAPKLVKPGQPSADKAKAAGDEVKAEKAPDRTEKAPVKAEKAPVKAEKAPVKAEQAPVKAEKAPVKAEQAPVKAEQAPATAASAGTSAPEVKPPDNIGKARVAAPAPGEPQEGQGLLGKGDTPPQVGGVEVAQAPQASPADSAPVPAQEPAAARSYKKGDSSLSSVPYRAAVAFEEKAAENRKQAAALVDKQLKGLRDVGSWHINSSNAAQLKSALSKLEQHRAKVEEAGKLYTEAYGYERSALRMRAKAAQVEELETGKPADLEPIQARIKLLESGAPQAEALAGLTGIRLLVDALAQYIKGDLAQALVLTAKAIEANAQLALAHVYRGSFFYLTQNKEQAVEAWSRALELDPQDADLRQALDSVKNGK